MTDTVEQLLTRAECLAALRVGNDKLSELRSSGELPTVRFGRRTLFKKSDVDALVARHTDPTAGGVM